jgi:hypothetical protein
VSGREIIDGYGAGSTAFGATTTEAVYLLWSACMQQAARVVISSREVPR